MSSTAPLYLGVDLGTSGVRSTLIDSQKRPVASTGFSYSCYSDRNDQARQKPEVWWEGVVRVCNLLAPELRQRIVSMAVDATSGTLLLASAPPDASPTSEALLYNDPRPIEEATAIAAVAPTGSAAHGTASALAKWLWLVRQEATGLPFTQGEWVTTRLTGHRRCDENCALKLGWDPVCREWPDWIARLGLDPSSLPAVLPPTTTIGRLTADSAATLGLPPSTLVCAGTSDSTAALIASGVSEVGEAMTSLGSTLVTKIVTASPIFAPEYGVYSQPLAGRWLVGAGSNSGGAVLRHLFSDSEIEELSGQIDPAQSSGLDYYPLLSPGERFPICDPFLAPRIEPVPPERSRLLHGLLEGISEIERLAYRRLESLGAPWPSSIRTTGGGAKNRVWQTIRQQKLGIDIIPARSSEASHGAAILALTGFSRTN